MGDLNFDPSIIIAAAERVQRMTSRLVAMSVAGMGGGIEGLDKEELDAYLEQMEEIAGLAHASSTTITRVLHSTYPAEYRARGVAPQPSADA
ncbi:hypothetical protein PTE30175_03853 [Pandoraea terrae]|uniref:Uncharacterized protein n=1 Tax=Pandoraea terrae TaxID=1537710 RepID=A0A5E4XL46_9BURK|nr:hypothetical protein [Pandoraea terrae]VVE37016.1 hypothetical protein PTE30175_03853 [Pandoraea terrae]